MKLKKVISLVLGGVLTLSMLAGCTVSSGTTGGTETLTETPTTNTAVVAEVVANLKAAKSTIGETQANTDLTGNETADLETALKGFSSAQVLTQRADLVSAVTAALVPANEGESTVIVMQKVDGLTDAKIGISIYNGILGSKNANGQRAAKLSVFDATSVDTSNVTSGNVSTSISGSSVDYSVSATTTEYWVIVITAAADESKTTSTADTGTF